jgi:Derlin-2/3
MTENTPDQWYKSLPPLTRIGLTTFFIATVLVQLEILNPNLLSLHWLLVIQKLQIWRLFTSVCFFGTFSFRFIFQLYFFSSFSSKLEQNECFQQPGEYLFFLILQVLLLDVISLILAWPTGMPMLGPALIFAIIYYWSRREPHANLSFFSFTIKGYQFPFALLAFQILMGGNIWGDLLGLGSGHLYYFLKDVVPAEYGRVLISTPRLLQDFMAQYSQGAGGGGAAPRPAMPNFGGGGQRLGGN